MEVAVTIEGISPLLMHAFPLMPIEGLEKKPPEEQARLALYQDEQGKPYIPGENVYRAFVSGAKYVKGKRGASLATVVAASVGVSPARLYLDGCRWQVDARPVRIKATQGTVVRYRPRFDAWSVSFTIDYDETLLKREELHRIVESTGARVGMLDFRPERKGPFGRFMVTEFK